MSTLNYLKVALLTVLFSCGIRDYYRLPLYSGNHLIQAVVEIPAGTNRHIQYCQTTHRFDLKVTGSSDDLIKFLPYPCNFGFIPSTLMKEGSNDQGRAIPVLIFSEALETGDVLEIIPLGILTVNRANHSEHMIVAVPYSKEVRLIDASSFRDLNEKYTGLIGIIEEWFRNSDLSGSTQVVSWQDEVLANKMIEMWAVK